MLRTSSPRHSIDKAARIAAKFDPPMVRFGSKADTCGAKGRVHFTPESGDVQGKWECPLRPIATHIGCSRPRLSAIFDDFAEHVRALSAFKYSFIVISADQALSVPATLARRIWGRRAATRLSEPDRLSSLRHNTHHNALSAPHVRAAH